MQGEGVVAGSLFRDRIFVRSKQHRILLLAFSSRSRGSADGLAADEYDSLTADFAELPADSQEAALLPFLSADEIGQRRYATAQHRVLLHILGTSAPACQLMKPVAFEVIGHIIDGNMTAVSLDMVKPLAARCPQLWSFLRPFMGMTDLPGHVKTLLAAILKVR